MVIYFGPIIGSWLLDSRKFQVQDKSQGKTQHEQLMDFCKARRKNMNVICSKYLSINDADTIPTS